MSVQAQVLGLLEELRQRLHLTYIFISHDLGVVKRISNRVLVMYLGHVVEEGDDGAAVSRNPLHPYTQALDSRRHHRRRPGFGRNRRRSLKGEIPSPMNPPSRVALSNPLPQGHGCLPPGISSLGQR